MKPINFEGANKVFKLPGGTSENDLHVLDDGESLHSVWQPNAGDRQKIARGDALLLSIQGRHQPPVIIQVVDSEVDQRRATFKIFQGKDGKHYFHLKALNGEIVLQSEGYETEQGAEHGINVIRNLAYDANIEKS